MLSISVMKLLRTIRVLCVAIAFLSNPVAMAAVNPSGDLSDADYSVKTRDLDTQMRNIINTPVDFCDPVAMEAHGNAYLSVHFEKFQLQRQREKAHPTLEQSAKAAESVFADEGLLPEDDTPIVEDYEAAMRRGDISAANALMTKMTPWEQVQAGDWSHNYGPVFKILTPMADQGDVKAQRRLASIYSWATNFNIPSPTPRDDALAFKYARLASLNGDEVAQEILAKAYACGLGTERNPVQAYAWFSIAISQSALMLKTNDQPEELLRRRDYLASEMSRDDIQRAKHLLIKCYKSQYKACD